MTQIIIKPDCRNAPKKEFLREFNIAFATGNVHFLRDHLSEDAIWTIHGDQKVIGKEKIVEKIGKMSEQLAEELIIHSIITHGAEAAVNGEIKMKSQNYAFCDVYRFTSAGSKVLKEISSYVIKSFE